MKKALIITALLSAITLAQNYRVLDRVQVGSDTDQATVIFDVLQSKQVTYSFDVDCPDDPNLGDTTLSVSAVVGTTDLTVTRTAINQTTWTATYEFTWTPAIGTHYVDITATDTRGLCQPVILKGGGLSRLDPNYDYTLARTDPIEHQKAVKHTQRYWYLTGQTILHNVRF